MPEPRPVSLPYTPGTRLACAGVDGCVEWDKSSEAPVKAHEILRARVDFDVPVEVGGRWTGARNVRERWYIATYLPRSYCCAVVILSPLCEVARWRGGEVAMKRGIDY
jgi:hypothetical protein